MRQDSAPALPGSVDLIVLGSGIGGLCAAIAARCFGLDVLILEKDRWFGGATARSGAAFYLPCSAQARAAGRSEAMAEVRRYLDHCVGGAADPALRETFLRHAADALAFFERHSELRLDLRPVAPDYHPELPSASDSGRVLDVREFDGRRLGRRLRDLRPPIETHVLFGGMAVSRRDVQILMQAHRSPAAIWHGAKLAARSAWRRFRYGRDTRLVHGNALVGRLAATVFAQGTPLIVQCPATALIVGHDGAVTGVVATQSGGAPRRIVARHGVVLATGGFSADAAESARHRPNSVSPHVSMIPDANTGDGLRLGADAGGAAATPGAGAFFWAPVSVLRRRDGAMRRFAHLTTDRAKPGVIAVDRRGARFTNEADSYHRFGAALQPLTREEGDTPIAYLLCDATALHRHGLGIAKPFPAHLPNRGLIRDGYLIEAPTIERLAERLAVPAAALRATIERHNRDAVRGVDTVFGKGGSSHNRALGDAANTPNPCLAEIATPPFYAVALCSGDLGTARGLRTDARARVVDAAGRAIPGLYAVGNDMQSAMGGTYPGPGITLGPALVFAWVAARDAAARAGRTMEDAGAPTSTG